MKVIIPAKASSSRVPDKNWREFYHRKSLVDLNIEAIIGCGFKPSDIYVSSECPDRLARVEERYGIIPILRPLDLCGNDVPLTTWIRATCTQVPGDSDIIWSQVCDPLFNEHQAVLSQWEAARTCHDSLVVVHPLRAYLLDEHHRPIGWQWGEWHTPSQRLPQCYTFPFTMSVLTREAIARTGYHIGVKPAWFVSNTKSIDIDTPEDWELARITYAALKSKWMEPI
jgi:CMP-N-acetylneuraminic acid synthetase